MAANKPFVIGPRKLTKWGTLLQNKEAENEQRNLCAVCSTEADLKCPICRSTHYCSKAHQLEHWPDHSPRCYPFTIKKDENGLSFLCSTRDIKAGEVILKEKALYYSPAPTSQPCCVACCKELTERYHPCYKCFWPMCGTTCPKRKDHNPECDLSRGTYEQMSQLIKRKTEVLYEYIGPLRLLSFLSVDPAKFKDVIKNGRKNPLLQLTNIKHRNLSLQMKTVLGLGNLDDADLSDSFHVSKIRSVCIGNTGKMGFFEKCTLIRSKCSANVFLSFNEKEEQVVRASIDIPKHRELMVSHSNPFDGSYKRRLKNLELKIECQCRWCSDPSDNGTRISCLCCPNCEGCVYPSTNVKDPRNCVSCPEENIKEFDESILEDFLNKSDCDAIVEGEDILNSTKDILYEDHYIRLQVKRRLGQLYGLENFENNEEICQFNWQKKVDALRSVIKVAKTLQIGYCKLLGDSMFELYMTLMQSYRNIPDVDVEENIVIENLEEKIAILREMKPLVEPIRTIFMKDSVLKSERDFLKKVNSSSSKYLDDNIAFLERHIEMNRPAVAEVNLS